MGPKRAKMDESTSDSSPSESISSVIEEPGDKQLTEISVKLSLILTAIQDLTDVVRETNKRISPAQTETAVSEISRVVKEIDENIKKKIPQQTAIVENTNEVRNNSFESEAMLVKNRISDLWNKKLNARRDAFWGKVRNGGHLKFYEKWISSTPIIVPKKIQKAEFINEREDQRMLRERAVLQDFKMEIEMLKLREDSCIERIRRLDTEVEEIVFGKCSGPASDYLIDLWKQQVKKNEDISYKRWLNNERWLNSYEANFLNSYQNTNPFFKKPASHRNRQDKGPASYADAVKSRPRSRQRIQRPDQSLRNLLQELTFKLNGPRRLNRRRFQQNNYGKTDQTIPSSIQELMWSILMP